MKRFLMTFEKAASSGYVTPEVAVVNLDSEGVLCSSINAIDIEDFSQESGSVQF